MHRSEKTGFIWDLVLKAPVHTSVMWFAPRGLEILINLVIEEKPKNYDTTFHYYIMCGIAPNFVSVLTDYVNLFLFSHLNIVMCTQCFFLV